MPYKTMDEVEERLRERYDGPTYQREGNAGMTFTYIPWENSVRLLDEIFGVFGWTASAPQAVCAEGQWTVTFGITVRVLDAAGTLIEKTVPCVGSARAQDDNSAKKAMSDALSKGVKFLGDGFGFYIGEEAKKQRATGARQGNATNHTNNVTQYQPRQSSGEEMSKAQYGKLKSLGFEPPKGMTKREASAKIEELLQTAEPVF